MAEVHESKDIPGVWLVRLESFGDRRGRFMETYRASWLPFAAPMVQGNRSESAPRVLRGLHYHRRQADLWYVQAGRVTTVLLDTRVGSPAEGRHLSLQQGGGEEVAVYIPEGVAHGFLTLEPDTDVLYQIAPAYRPGHEAGVRWDDPAFGIDWPSPPSLISDRDASYPDYRG